MERGKDMELFNGIMDKNLKVIGKKELNVDSVSGDLPKEIIMKVNGLIIGNKEKVSSSIEIVHTKEHLKTF